MKKLTLFYYNYVYPNKENPEPSDWNTKYMRRQEERKKAERNAKRRRACRKLKYPAIYVMFFCIPFITMWLMLSAAGRNYDAVRKNNTNSNTTAKEISETIPRISAYEAGNTYFYNISQEDKINMAKVVYVEARGEEFEGQVAVAAVILNRYYCSDPNCFDTDSIYSVITQRGQFCDISHVSNENLNECPSCFEAVEAACKGWDPTRRMFEDGALYFYAPAGVTGYQAEIREGVKGLNIGNHRFHIDFNTP